MLLHKKDVRVFYLFICISLLYSCTKSDIQFGTGLADSYLTVSRIDTIGIDMSTYFPDSFSTTNPSSLLIGKFKDPVLGTLSAKPFFQLTVPPNLQLSDDVVYDSMTLVLKPNKNYYGDTDKIQTIQVKELNAPIEYSYSNYLYNTSSVAEKSVPLGTATLKIKPNADDSIQIRLSDTKGAEIFQKIKQQDNDVLSQDAFLKYFQGLSVSFSGSESSLIIGTADSASLRIYYHNTIPYPVSNMIDMETYTGGIFFNQILADRTGTSFSSHLTSYPQELPSSLTDNTSFIQGMAGVMLKITFPGIRSFLEQDTMVKMLSANLVLKAQSGSYDATVLRLPDTLFLAGTNSTNVIGSALTASDGSIIYTSPVNDYIYNTPTYYSIDITSWLNSVLTGSATNDFALFVLQNYPGESGNMSRAIFSNSADLTKGSQLLLTYLTIKK
jgi:hypothetical protein